MNDATDDARLNTDSPVMPDSLAQRLANPVEPSDYQPNPDYGPKLSAELIAIHKDERERDQSKVNGRDLHIFGYANGRTFWHYSTEHSPEHVQGKDYFKAPHVTPIRPGDELTIEAHGMMFKAFCTSPFTVTAVTTPIPFTHEAP